MFYEKDLQEFRSGSDIRAKDCELTNDVVRSIAQGFVFFVAEKLKKDIKSLKISIGRDCRISSDRISDAFISGLLDCKVSVLDIGVSSTPAMFMTIIDLDCDAAVEVTASHHPFDRNGLKFFLGKEGGVNSEEIARILKYASIRRLENFDYMKKYCERIKDIIKIGTKKEKPLEDFKIVVDAGNGVGGFYANSILKPLGADVSCSQFLEPDGMFPNHEPNPENDIAIASLKSKVLDSRAHLGIIFDTDVDRCGFVDSNGNEINKNKLIALASAIVLKKSPGSTIVTDSVTSTGLTEFIEQKLCGKHERFKRGYRNVIDEAKRIGAPLAIETSGHAAFAENFYLDDGAYLAAKIIIEYVNLKGNPLSDIIKGLKEPLESLERRIPFAENADYFIEALKKEVLEDKMWSIENNNKEGLRVNVNCEEAKGWFLLRKSIHDKSLVLNAESENISGASFMVSEVLKILKKEGIKI